MSVLSTQSENLINCLILAYFDALKQRELLIFELRFGFDGEEPRSLQEVGDIIGVTGERIRQILLKCFRKIRSKGKRNITKGVLSNPCAQLLQLLKEIIRPGEMDEELRINQLINSELSFLPDVTHSIPLVLFLLSYSDEQVEILKQRLNKIKTDFWRKPPFTLTRDASFSKLLDDVIWPANSPKLIQTGMFSNFKQLRGINFTSDGNKGTFYSEKLQRDVFYESTLEYQFYRRIEYSKNIIFYQEQPFRIPYFVNDVAHNYYPDVFIVLKDGRGIVVEIKPPCHMALNINWKKWAALRQFCKENGYGFLITDAYASFQSVQRKAVPEDFKNSLLESLSRGTINWYQYLALREEFPVTYSEFTAIIMKYKLYFQLAPFIVKQN